MLKNHRAIIDPSLTLGLGKELKKSYKWHDTKITLVSSYNKLKMS